MLFGTVSTGIMVSQIHLWLPHIFHTPASYPFADAFTTIASILATILLSRKQIEFEYDENELPNTSVPSRQVSKIWADQFKLLLPQVDLLVTSEKYGDYVADYRNFGKLASKTCQD